MHVPSISSQPFIHYMYLVYPWILMLGTGRQGGGILFELTLGCATARREGLANPGLPEQPLQPCHKDPLDTGLLRQVQHAQRDVVHLHSSRLVRHI